MKLSVILLRRQCFDEINILPVEGYTLLGNLTLFIKKEYRMLLCAIHHPQKKITRLINSTALMWAEQFMWTLRLVNFNIF